MIPLVVRLMMRSKEQNMMGLKNMAQMSKTTVRMEETKQNRKVWFKLEAGERKFSFNWQLTGLKKV